MGKDLTWTERARLTCFKLALLCTLATCLASVLASFGEHWWVLDLLSHFRAQYLGLFALSVVTFVLLRRWRWSLASGLMLGASSYFVMPYYLSHPVVLPEHSPSLSVIAFNVNFANRGTKNIARYLAQQEADLVIIIEATAAMEEAISGALPNYQVLAETRDSAFGIVLYSRLPIDTQKVRYLGHAPLPALEVEIVHEDTTFSILSLHTMPPVSSQDSAIRDRMLVDAAAWAKTHTNALVLGDLNATPWSHAFSALLEEGELINSQVGFGLQTSWPDGLWPLSIPIDHLLHSKTLTTQERFVGPFLGSDHRPVHARIAALP